MHPLNQNSPKETDSDENPKESRKVLVFLSIALVFLIASATLGGILFASSAGIKPNTIFAKLRSLTLAREKKLNGEDEDRINILLLGMGGPGHDGATLTDTMMLVSLRPSDRKISLLSIPRDLQVNIPGYGYRKINSVNAYAEEKEPGTGAQAASAMVSQILDQPIHYYVRLDFQAFKEIIDSVGGIEVEVDQPFYDAFYPDENYGYAPVSFEAGRQKMDGDRALKFARSRHGTNGEGSDFARARRQQKMLFALKERLLSFDVLLRPTRIKNILASLNNHIQTNLALWEGLRIANLFKDTTKSNIVSQVLDASPEGVLVERNYDGAFVLETKSGNWDAVRAVASGVFDAPSSALMHAQKISPPVPSSSVKKPTTPAATPLPSSAALPIIEIQNGTKITGLAAKTAGTLEAMGFVTNTLGNASLRDVKATIVYDLTAGKKPDALSKLKLALHAIDGQGEPTHLISQGTLDFLVILGQNAVK